MWQYQNTDELYHTNMYKNMNKNLNNELYHSDVYLGKDFSDGIKHWKYIKREKVNGRWRYYYKDSKLDEMKGMNDTLNELSKNADELSKYYKNNPKMRSSEYAPTMFENGIRSPLLRKKQYHDYQYKQEKEKSDKRRAKYNRYLINPMNKVSDKVYSGKQKVSNVINNIKNNIKKKTFSIKQSFKKKQKA